MSAKRVPYPFRSLDHGLMRGDEVQADGDWWPVLGYAMTHHPDGTLSGTVFTSKPRGAFDGMGYRVDVHEITGARRP